MEKQTVKMNVESILDKLEGALYNEVAQMNIQERIENDYVNDLKEYISLKLVEDRDFNRIYIETLIEYVKKHKLIGYSLEKGKIAYCFDSMHVTNLETNMNIDHTNLTEDIVIDVLTKENVLLTNNIQNPYFNTILLYNIMKEYKYDVLLKEKMGSFLMYYDGALEDDLENNFLVKINKIMKKKNQESQKVLDRLHEHAEMKMTLGFADNFLDIIKEREDKVIYIDMDIDDTKKKEDLMLRHVSLGLCHISFYILGEVRLHLLKEQESINLENDDFAVMMFHKRSFLPKLTKSVLEKNNFSEIFLLSILNYEDYEELAEISEHTYEDEYNNCVIEIFSKIGTCEEEDLKKKIDNFKQEFPQIAKNRKEQINRVIKEVAYWKMLKNDSLNLDKNLQFTVTINIENFNKYVTLNEEINRDLKDWNKYVKDVTLVPKYKEKIKWSDNKELAGIDMIFDGEHINSQNYNSIVNIVFKEFVKMKKALFLATSQKADIYQLINSKIREEVLKIKLNDKILEVDQNNYKRTPVKGKI